MLGASTKRARWGDQDQQEQDDLWLDNLNSWGSNWWKSGWWSSSAQGSADPFAVQEPEQGEQHEVLENRDWKQLKHSRHLRVQKHKKSTAKAEQDAKDYRELKEKSDNFIIARTLAMALQAEQQASARSRGCRAQVQVAQVARRSVKGQL